MALSEPWRYPFLAADAWMPVGFADPICSAVSLVGRKRDIPTLSPVLGATKPRTQALESDAPSLPPWLLSSSGCVTLGRAPRLSELCFSPMSNGDGQQIPPNAASKSHPTHHSGNSAETNELQYHFSGSRNPPSIFPTSAPSRNFNLLKALFIVRNGRSVFNVTKTN